MSQAPKSGLDRLVSDGIEINPNRQCVVRGVSHMNLHLRGCSDVGWAEKCADKAAFCITDFSQRMYALCRLLIQDLFEQVR